MVNQARTWNFWYSHKYDHFLKNNPGSAMFLAFYLMDDLGDCEFDQR
ncbi:hypothetical protein AM1_5685 [Acaryochloris marina MBIC11017]|uniref:Uncharacterized protein n=1 Tax=Acaryochloris marina (strain MBIC 11017) TaxID=329726 RepID=B0CG79_ACAM1|nr:hypothetical protein AM1_5685 [Acaryochloris marina MBIC11017]